MATGNPSSGASVGIGSDLVDGGGRTLGTLFSSSLAVSSLEPRHLVWPCLQAGLLVLAVLGAWSMTGDGAIPTDAGVVVWLMVPLALGLLAARGSYRRCIQLDVFSDLLNIVVATSLAAIAVLAFEDLLDPAGASGALVVRAWVLSTLLLWASAPLLTAAERRLRRSGSSSVPTLVVGAGPVGTEIERRLRMEPELGLSVIGYVDAGSEPGDPQPERSTPILGAPDELLQVIDGTGARHVIVTFTDSPDQALLPLIRSCEERGVRISLVPRMFERVTHRVSLDSIGRVPLFSLGHVDPKGWRFIAKHAFDRVSSALLLVLLAPLLLVIAAAVRLSSPGPIVFRQSRVGRDGRHFEMLKFRSMRIPEAGQNAGIFKPGMAPGGVEGEDRRTAFGAFIRRYSLDELPQLLNVVKGEMSLIGPRPERPEFVQMFDQRVQGYADRHRVKSGITGLAQTNGLRGQTSLSDRVELDNYYIQHWSLKLDLRILVATFGAVLRSAE